MAPQHTSVAFFTEYAKQDDGDQSELVIPEDLTELSVEDLDALSDQALDAFKAIYGENGKGSEDKGLTPEELATLNTLTEGIDAIRAEKQVRSTIADELATEAAALAQRVLVDVDPEDDGDTDEETPEGEDSPEADEGEEAASETPELEAVAASARKEIRVRHRTPRVIPEPEPEVRSIKDIAFSADGKPVDRMDMAKAIDKRLSSFNDKLYANAARRGQKMSERFQIATFNRTFDPKAIVDKNAANADDAIAFAIDQSRLPGGSLLASGGWCAPSETVYDLCNLSEAADLVSLPEIQINRGGISHTMGPDYASIFADTGFCYTEEDDTDGDYNGSGGGTKPCFTVGCPEFTDDRLGYCGVCISAGILQSKGYPEMIAQTIDIALNAHAHRVSASVINSLVQGSTVVTLPSNQAGATAPLLTALDLQATHYRAVNRMRRNAPLEVILPTWTMLVLRADLARRQGVDLLDVPESRVNAWLQARFLSAQYVVDWQDISSTPASGFTATPTSIDFLLYAAGTWVKGVTSSFTMENIYDSVGLGTNDFTALFTEDPYLVAKRCHDSRVVTVPICADGATKLGVNIKCDGSV